MVWTEILGLPLCSWGSNAYKKAASMSDNDKEPDSESHKEEDIQEALQETQEDSDVSKDKEETLDGDKEDRVKLLKERDDIQQLEDMDLIQKARVKWDVEENENTKFFYGILKQKMSHQAVQGIMIDGSWATNPHQVKTAFVNFYKEKLDISDSLIDLYTITSHSNLNHNDNLVLEKDVVEDEIRQDMNNIIRILHVFYLASGLKINVSKSNVDGLGVNSHDINVLAHDTDANADCLLSNRRVNDSWIWNWKRHVEGSRNEADLDSLVSDSGEVKILDEPDSWSWNLNDNGVFSVRLMRIYLASCLLPSRSPCTRWFKILP
nr:RNA-directed DNA polymerase, eukaryota, reverse transcriptase zinc-binding domain protein [Tanacetum cinerariifolium]